MSGTAADEDLIFEAVVPMTREALVGSIMRRVGVRHAHAAAIGAIGPIAAWKTDTGFHLRRSGLFRLPHWMTLDATVDDLGDACRVHGRVGWHPEMEQERRKAVAWVAFCLALGFTVLVLALIDGRGRLGLFEEVIGWLIVFALALIRAMQAFYRQFYASRRRAPADRVFLVEWLERLIDAPVTVRRAGGEP
ncbi:hypothetical protein [Roseomonas fluvialis]|uniref:Uncharacterized protein n=1 Tax=Roseomonas fluvialis TaxID=1750527 RepID=A0ABN6P2M3_9PROT|nr:hypothetical protein [Roseomonas fluvialis]BDG72895.1 hypothetical protein Rmf_28240 [Roseomonas fluvialis]